MELIKELNKTAEKSEHAKQVRVVLDFIKRGELTKLHHSQMEDTADMISDEEMERIFDGFTFIK